MASIVVAGDTSGTVTLAAPSVAGTTTLTLPTANGTLITTGSSGQSIPRAALPTGSVLQVVNGFTSTMVTTTTTDVWVDTGIVANITPFFATSKILVIANICGIVKKDNNSFNRMGIRLLRNATVLGISSLRNLYTATTMQFSSPGAMYSKLDSPNTTSSITYGVQFMAEALSANNGVSVQTDNNSGESQIFLMEIAA